MKLFVLEIGSLHIFELLPYIFYLKLFSFRDGTLPKDISATMDDLPAQPYCKSYPTTFIGSTGYQFESKWYKKYPWMEYSLQSNKVFCFPCRHFKVVVNMRNARYATTGFDAWNNASYRLKSHAKAPTHQEACRQWMQRRRGERGGPLGVIGSSLMVGRSYQVSPTPAQSSSSAKTSMSDADEGDDESDDDDPSPRIQVRGTGYDGYESSDGGGKSDSVGDEEKRSDDEMHQMMAEQYRKRAAARMKIRQEMAARNNKRNELQSIAKKEMIKVPSEPIMTTQVKNQASAVLTNINSEEIPTADLMESAL